MTGCFDGRCVSVDSGRWDTAVRGGLSPLLQDLSTYSSRPEGGLASARR
jgi:hypothetical protein